VECLDDQRKQQARQWNSTQSALCRTDYLEQGYDAQESEDWKTRHPSEFEGCLGHPACSTHTESESCSNNRTYYIDVIEQAVLSGLRSELRAPAVLAEYVKAYHEERARLAANSTAQRSTLSRRIDEIVRETQRLVDAIAKGHGDPAILGGRVNELACERRQHETMLSALPEAGKVVALHTLACSPATSATSPTSKPCWQQVLPLAIRRE
jgi:hypothetical protein